MVAGNIEDRIKKMKEAILNQAKQRASTIVKNADDEAHNERAMLVELQKEKLHQQYILLNKAERVKEKIEKSALNNRHRIRRMQARYEYVEKLRAQVIQKLKDVVRNEAKYNELLGKLIVQGMLRMMERNINVELKNDQIPRVVKLFPQCEKDFTTIMQEETGRTMESRLNVSEYHLEEANKTIIGGVYLRSSDGVIICDNSLDSRVRLIFEQLLPSIRGLLFPKTEVKRVV